MKKILTSFLIVIMLFTFISPVCFAKDKDEDITFKEQVKKEDGSLFEKIIAECIAGVAQTIYDITRGLDVGFKDYDSLLFNANILNSDMAPFSITTWERTMNCYKVFALISGSLILIAVIILAYKMSVAGMNISKKNEAKESLMRLLFGGVAIALAPLFIRFLLFLNNGFVEIITASHGSLDDLIGHNMLSSIETGNAVTTAIVIAMFVYLFIKLNIKFIIRQFTLIIFTIFTPFAVGLWIINKNVTAAAIWAGQIMMNVFMQFIYCFLFVIYLNFLPSDSGWAISIIWAMMILPLADALQNCFQNLTSRIAGVDNEQMSNRVIGTSAMLGFGIGAIAEQFKTPQSKNNNGDGNSTVGLKGFFNRAKSVVNPSTNLSDEKDYNGNVNPIKNVVPKQTANNTVVTPNSNIVNQNELTNSTKISPKNIVGAVGKVASTGVKATTAYLGVGYSLVEGDFSHYQHRPNKKKSQNKNNYKNIEYMNRLEENRNSEEIGDDNEFK